MKPISEKTENNVVGVRFLLEDATYVLGQLAATFKVLLQKQ